MDPKTWAALISALQFIQAPSVPPLHSKSDQAFSLQRQMLALGIVKIKVVIHIKKSLRPGTHHPGSQPVRLLPWIPVYGFVPFSLHSVMLIKKETLINVQPLSNQWGPLLSLCHWLVLNF